MSALRELKLLLEEVDVHERQRKVDRWWQEWIAQVEILTAVDEELILLNSSSGQDARGFIEGELRVARRHLAEEIARSGCVVEEECASNPGDHERRYRQYVGVLRSSAQRSRNFADEIRTWYDDMLSRVADRREEVRLRNLYPRIDPPDANLSSGAAMSRPVGPPAPPLPPGPGSERWWTWRVTTTPEGHMSRPHRVNIDPRIEGATPQRVIIDEILEGVHELADRRSAREGSDDGRGEGEQAGEVRPPAGPPTPGTR